MKPEGVVFVAHPVTGAKCAMECATLAQWDTEAQLSGVGPASAKPSTVAAFARGRGCGTGV